MLRGPIRPRVWSLLVTLAGAFAVTAGIGTWSGGDVAPPLFALDAAGAPQSSTGLLQAQNLVYNGAFRIPRGGVDDEHSANLGGNCMTYNPAGNGGQGSLLICGMDTGRLVGEISIPTPAISSNLSSLPTASLIHNFVDVLQGHADDVCPGCSKSNFLGGLLQYGGQLIVTVYVYFDTDSKSHPLSHFVASADLANPRYIGGPYQVGDPAMPGFVAGFMTPVPAAYQSALGGPFLTGQCCIPITTRTSYGPSASVFNPGDLGRTNPVPATRLLGYTPSNHSLGDWGSSGGLWNGSSRAIGAAFPVGTRTVLYFGHLGTGPFCYGIGTDNQSLAGTKSPSGDIYCYDPAHVGQKGPFNYPYKFLVYAYDANDLAAVKAGQKAFYDVMPYATWDLNLPILYPAGSAARYNIGSVAYDEVNQRIFVAQKEIDQFGGTIINVFTVQTGTTSAGLCRY